MKLPVMYDALSISKKIRVRMEYICIQGGNCSYCKAPLSGPADDRVKCKPVNDRLFPSGFFKWPVHLHHDRKTGLTIGAVHNYCNAVLWQYHGE